MFKHKDELGEGERRRGVCVCGPVPFSSLVSMMSSISRSALLRLY